MSTSLYSFLDQARESLLEWAMAKNDKGSTTLKTVVAKVKFHTQEAGISLRLIGDEGKPKPVSPGISAKVIDSGEFLYVSIPATSQVYRKNESGKGYKPATDADGPAALNSFHPVVEAIKRATKAPAKGKGKQVVVPSALSAVLKDLPKGFRYIIENGEVKMVKTREKRK